MDRSAVPDARRTWAMALAGVTVLLCWNLGGYGLWDPWETHYAEVARQVLVRGDPINLWWQPGTGPDGLAEQRFLSKPALAFWLMAGSLWTAGIDGSIDPAAMAAGPWPEIAARLPSSMLCVATCWVVARTVRRLVGAAAGLLTLACGASVPLVGLMGRQALTDMPMVATMSWALCAIAIAELDPAARQDLPRRRLVGFTVPWSTWTVLSLGLLVSGGVVPVVVITAASREWAQMIPYQLALLVVVVGLARARCVQQLAWIVAHACLGLSFMAKGVIGPGLAAATVLVFALTQGRVVQIARNGLLGFAPLAFVCTGLPWYHAMVVRKGGRFLGSLLFQHQLRRFASGEQSQAVGDLTFHVRTLALGAFPWVVWLPAAIARLWPRKTAGDPAASFGVLVLCWLVVGFGVVSFSATKYHHYLLPQMPAVAAALGITLARLPSAHRRAYVLAGLTIWGLVILELWREPGSLVQLATYVHDGAWSELPVTAVWIVVGSAPVVLGLLAWSRPRSAALAVPATVVAGVLVSAATLHEYVPRASVAWSQKPMHTAAAEAVAIHPELADVPLVAWRLNHRGETFYSAGSVWVSIHGDDDALRERLGIPDGPRAHLLLTVPRHRAELEALAPGWTIETVESTRQRLLLHMHP